MTSSICRSLVSKCVCFYLSLVYYQQTTITSIYLLSLVSILNLYNDDCYNALIELFCYTILPKCTVYIV